MDVSRLRANGPLPSSSGINEMRSDTLKVDILMRLTFLRCNLPGQWIGDHFHLLILSFLFLKDQSGSLYVIITFLRCNLAG